MTRQQKRDDDYVEDRPYSYKEDTWHLNKSVPISIIAVVAVQIVGTIIWSAKLDGRVEALERLTARQDVQISTLQANGSAAVARLAAIEAILERIEARLSRLDDNGIPSHNHNGNGNAQ